MARDDDRQPGHRVRRIVAPLGVDPQQAVGQVDGRVGGYEQVADVAHVGIDVVDRLAAVAAAAASGQQQPAQADGKDSHSHRVSVRFRFRIGFCTKIR